MENHQDLKFALLIDGDNIGSQYIKTILDEMTNEGVVTYKRIYGDWTAPNLKPWKEILLEHSITPVQQYSYTTGKNATDSAMIIDAMDILYSGKIDGFCLASSDSDFTRLAARLREAGMIVIGMGKQQTPKPFVSACSKFKYVDLISKEETEKKNNVSALEATKKSNSKKSTVAKAVFSPEDDIKTYITKAIEENAEESGLMLVSLLGTMLPKKYPDFDPRNFGEKKLSNLLGKWGFRLETYQDPNNTATPSGLIVYVGIKNKYDRAAGFPPCCFTFSPLFSSDTSLSFPYATGIC